MVSASDVPALSERAAFRSVGQGGVLLDTKSGQIFSCNDTAREFLSQIDGQSSIQALCRKISENYEVDVSELESDMCALTAELVAEDLLRIV